MKPICLRGHEKPITTIKFNSDGDLFFTGAGEKKVNLWQAYSGERIGSYDCEGAVRTLDVTVESEYLVVGTLVGALEFFRVEGGKHLGRISFEAKILSVEFSYGDHQLLVLLDWYAKDKSGSNTILVYDFEKILKQLKSAPKSDDKGNIFKLTVEPEKSFLFKKKFTKAAWGFLNKSIFVSTEDGNLDVLNLEGKVDKTVVVYDGPDAGGARNFSIAKDHSLILVCTAEGAKLFDPKTLKLLKTFKTEVPMNTGVISPLVFDKKNPKYHAIMGGGVAARDAARDKMGGFDIRLVNLVYEEAIGSIAGHFGPVNTLAFHKDGRGFVSGGEEGLIRIFRFAPKYFSDLE